MAHRLAALISIVVFIACGRANSPEDETAPPSEPGATGQPDPGGGGGPTDPPAEVPPGPEAPPPAPPPLPPKLTGALEWRTDLGADREQQVMAVGTSPLGNVFLGAIYFGSPTYGTQQMPPSAPIGNGGAAVVKLTPAGKVTWAKGFAARTEGTANLTALAVDAQGSVVAGGVVEGDVDFGPADPGGFRKIPKAIFLVKLAWDGSTVFVKTFELPRSSDVVLEGLSFDAQGNLYGGGNFARGTLNFGGAALTATSNTGFLFKLSGAGNHLWSKSFGNDQTEVLGGSVAADAAGNVVWGGAAYGKVSFGGKDIGVTKPPPGGDPAALLAMFDPQGGHRWSSHVGGGLGFIASVAFNGEFAAVTGALRGGASFASQTFPPEPNSAFIAVYSSSGTEKWMRRPKGAPEQTYGSEVALDSHGYAVLAGNACGALDFGGGARTADDDPNTSERENCGGFAAKYATGTGAHQWSRFVSPTTVFGVAVTPAGKTVAGGSRQVPKPDFDDRVSVLSVVQLAP